MRWYDPISERWIETKEKLPEPKWPEAQENIYDRAERLNRIDKIWKAIEDVSSA